MMNLLDDKFINEANPEKGISIIHLKSSIKEYTEAVIDHMKSRLSTSISSWCKQSLVRDCIEVQFSNLLLSQRGNMSSYQEDLAKVKVNLNLPVDGDEIGNKMAPSTANRLVSAGGSLLIGDIFGAITGGLLGFKAMLTTLAAELTAGIVLGIVSLFTPVGLPAMIIAAVIAALTGAGANLMSVKSNIKKKIIEETKKALGDSKDKFSNEIFNAVKGTLSQVQTKIKDELNGPINEAQSLVNEANANMNSDGVAMQQKVRKLTQLKTTNDQLAADLDKFAEKFAV